MPDDNPANWTAAERREANKNREALEEIMVAQGRARSSPAPKAIWTGRTECSMCGAKGDPWEFDDSGRCADCAP